MKLKSTNKNRRIKRKAVQEKKKPVIVRLRPRMIGHMSISIEEVKNHARRRKKA